MSIDKEKLLKECKCLTDGYKFTYCMNQCKHYTGGENFQECITKIIKNFPEEPDQAINFDALYNEFYKNECDGKTCSGCKYNNTCADTDGCFAQFLKSKTLTQPQPATTIDFDALYDEYYSSLNPVTYSGMSYKDARADSFRDFLKSKHLTATKPFEIPVKKTWKVKSEKVDMFTRFKISIEDYVKLELPYEPDNFIKQYYDLHEEPDWTQIPVRSVIGWNVPGDPPEKEEIGIFEGYEDGYVRFKGHVLPTKNYKWNFRVVELAKGGA